MDARYPRTGMIASVLCFFVLGCSAPATQTAQQTTQAACSYPMVRMFGVADNFSTGGTPDPIPYNPAFPQFVTFLNGQGIPTAAMKTFDDPTPNRHMVATLRHGLRGCFGGATALSLCFRARALTAGPGNDSVTIYNTNFSNNTFPVIYSKAIVPTLAPAWTTGTTSLLCIDLTPQMTSNVIGDMLQFRAQDDTAVDFIAMLLF